MRDNLKTVFQQELFLKGKTKMKKTKQRLLVLLTYCVIICNVFTSAMVAAAINQDDIMPQSIGLTDGKGELRPMKAMACWSTLSSGLNYYIGKNNWSYDANGQPCADGFKITVYDNGTCHVAGDDVSYSFRFSTYN